MSTNIESVTIASGAAISSVAKIHDNLVLAVIVAGWTVADMSFQGSVDGTNYYDLYDATGAIIDITPVANAASQIADPLSFAPWNFVKVKSVASGVAVNQATSRTVNLLLEEKL